MRYLPTKDQGNLALACKWTHAAICSSPCQHMRLLWRLYRHYKRTQSNEDIRDAEQIVDIWASNPKKYMHFPGWQNRKPEMWICQKIAKLGWVDMLAYARAQGCKWDRTTPMSAAFHGQLESLRYAHEHGCEWRGDTPSHAANAGHFECLRYAHEHGCEWGWPVASLTGSLECLRYVYEHGCPWNMWTTQIAACTGKLECLKYAHEHGCEWRSSLTWFAAARGHLKCLQYAHENGCAWDHRIAQLGRRAKRTKDHAWRALQVARRECYAYAIRHGCPKNAREFVFGEKPTPSGGCPACLQACA